MTTTVHSGYSRHELFSAAAAAAERAPQLAPEIRGHLRHLGERSASGAPMRTTDLDVRTLVSLIGQAGVAVPPSRVTSG